MKNAHLLLENQICFRVYSLEKAIMAAYKPVLSVLGLTYPQYLVMMVLWEKHETTIGGLCSALGLDTGTISPLVKRMEKNGLLSRKRLAEDERTVSVSLTDIGNNLRYEAADVPFKLGECLYGVEGAFDLPAYNRLKDALDEALDSLRRCSCSGPS